MVLARGYDVSDYQSAIPSDAEFVFIKASEGARTGQSGYTVKVAAARARGMVVGHYHFIHCENPVQGEIDHFCRVVGAVPTGELLVLDFEPYGQPVSDGAATAAKNAWLAAVKARYPNNRVGVYTSVDWWRRTDDNAGDFLWIADYVPAGSPRIQAAWRFHQWTDSPVDSNVFNGTIDDLRAWAAGGTAPSAPSVPTASWPGLQLVTRDQWGARPWREPNGSIPYAGPRAGVKVHYLGTGYAFGDHATCPAYVRKIQAEHMDGSGWSDIGYSFVVCEHGYTFEGRGLTRRNSANGDVPLNEAHYAVCGLVGSSGSTVPTPEQLNGLRDAIEYCEQQGPAGPEIKGHKDGYSTDCPGPALYAWVQTGAPRPTTPLTEDDMPLTGDDADNVAHSVLYWLGAALGAIDADPGQHPLSAVIPALRQRFAAMPADVWNHQLPNMTRQADGSWGPDGTTKEAYWWLVWQDPFQAQLLDAVKASALGPDQLHQALADGTLRVQVTVAAASDTNSPKGNS